MSFNEEALESAVIELLEAEQFQHCKGERDLKIKWSDISFRIKS
jgi:hypothetical protein